MIPNFYPLPAELDDPDFGTGPTHKLTPEEIKRRAAAETGHWQEAEDRGVTKVEAFFEDDFYERLNEIRRGLITLADKARERRRVQAFLADIERGEWED